MEKDYRPPLYSDPQMGQTGVNHPGQQAVFPPQAGQLIFNINLTNKKQQDIYTNVIEVTENVRTLIPKCELIFISLCCRNCIFIISFMEGLQGSQMCDVSIRDVRTAL